MRIIQDRHSPEGGGGPNDRSIDKIARVKGIDGLKGISALFIAFLWHYQHFGPLVATYPGYDILPPLYDFAGYFCELFFILSGFGMMMGYGKRISAGAMTFIQYMSKRLKRLYPVYFLAIVSTLLIELAIFHWNGIFFLHWTITISDVIADLFLYGHIIDRNNIINVSLWFVPVIILCYIVFFFLMKMSKGDKDKMMVFLIITSLTGIIIMLMGLNYPLLNNSVARGLICFPIGALIAILYQKKDDINTIKIGIASILLLLVITAIVKYDDYDHVGIWNLVAALAVMPAIFLATLFIPPINKVMDIKPLRYLGSISIYIFFFHFPVQCCFYFVDKTYSLGIDYTSIWTWSLYVGMTLLVSIIYKIIGKYYERSLLELINVVKR